jgi:hypothetical protein
MGESQSAYYEDHEPVPYIRAEMPEEVQRNKNKPGFIYEAMVPSLPFYPGEEIPDVGITEDVVIETGDINIYYDSNNGAKLTAGVLLLFFLFYWLSRRGR